MNPVDRDRGLRVVGVVTCAMAAVSLVGIGTATALAAAETQQRDALKAASAAVPEQVTEATPTPRATGKKRANRSKPKIVESASAAEKAEKAEQAEAEQEAGEPAKATNPKPKKPTTPAAEPTEEPPAVPSTGS